MACMREETFGPTVPIMKVRDAEEAVRLANDTSYGLQASVWTKDAAKGERLARRIEAGSVTVNDAQVNYVALELPMGGWKESGLGTRHGADGIRKYTKKQSVLVTKFAPMKKDLHMLPYSEKRTRLPGAAPEAGLRALTADYHRRMGRTYRHQALIDAPVGDVWEIVSDPRTHPGLVARRRRGSMRRSASPRATSTCTCGKMVPLRRRRRLHLGRGAARGAEGGAVPVHDDRHLGALPRSRRRRMRPTSRWRRDRSGVVEVEARGALPRAPVQALAARRARRAAGSDSFAPRCRVISRYLRVKTHASRQALIGRYCR